MKFFCHSLCGLLVYFVTVKTVCCIISSFFRLHGQTQGKNSAQWTIL